MDATNYLEYWCEDLGIDCSKISDDDWDKLERELDGDINDILNSELDKPEIKEKYKTKLKKAYGNRTK